MAYNANIPNAGDRFKDSQPQLKANFQDLVSFQGSVSNMTKQAMDPTTSSTQMALYVRQSPSSGINEVAIRRSNSGSIVDITAFNTISNGQNWTYIPSGFLIKTGIISVATNPLTIPINYGPAFSNILSIQLTVNDGGTNAVFAMVNSYIQSLINVRLSALPSPSSTQVHYMVIGI